MHSFLIALEVVGLVVLAGIAAGVIRGLSDYYRVRFIGFFNKKMGGKSFILLSGDPLAVKQAYDVCVSVLRVAEAETAAKNQKVAIAHGTDGPSGPGPTGAAAQE